MNSKRFTIFFICLSSLAYFSANGQRQHYIDSLLETLSSSTDLEKINVYNTLSWSYKFSNPQLAFDYGKKSYDLSKKLNDNLLEVKALNRMGAAKLRLGELSGALEILLRGIKICRSNDYYRVLATTMRQVGDVYDAQGNTSEAMKYYYNSLSIGDSLDIPIIAARSAKTVANLYIKLRQPKTAKIYLDFAHEVFEEDGFLRGLHQVHILYGDFYFVKNLPDSALINYGLALNYLDKLKDKEGYATAKAKIAMVEASKGRYKASIEGYKSALDTFIVVGDKKQIVAIKIAMAEAYSNYNNTKKGILIAENGLAEAKLFGLAEEEKNANHLLFTFYKKEGNLETAISHLENYLFLMDSLTHSTESWRVEQMRKSYDLEIQMKENELNTAVIANQTLTIKNERLLKWYLIALIIAVIILAGIILIALRHTRKTNEQLLLAIEEKNESISLISHDLKSPFNKIKGLTHLLELQSDGYDEEHKDLLSKINTVSHEGLNLVQNLVDIKMLQSGSFRLKLNMFDLNDFLQKRVQGFENIARPKEIVLNIEAANNPLIVNSDQNSIARIFDNLLSNAIKFSPNGETVTINYSVKEDHFSISISDNGKGIEQEEINQIFNHYNTGNSMPTGNEISSGLGLAIVSSFANKLGGEISCVSEVSKGATFIINLPLNDTDKG